MAWLQLNPWDVGFLVDQWKQHIFQKFSPPEAGQSLLKLVKTLGLEKEFKRIIVDDQDRPGKQLDRCVGIEPPHVVAVSLIPIAEFGHALHFASVDQSIAFVMRYPKETWTEGVGEAVMVQLATIRG